MHTFEALALDDFYFSLQFRRHRLLSLLKNGVDGNRFKDSELTSWFELAVYPTSKWPTRKQRIESHQSVMEIV